MTSQQFEQYVNRLLNSYGYHSINPRNRVLGRGTTHQIDAIGISKTTHTFSYPITIIAEAKYYNNRRTLGIEIMRNLYGVIQDIKQKIPNHFSLPSLTARQYINGTSNIVGVVITTTSFSSFAREFAYSHGIYMVSIGFLKKNHNPFFGNLDGQPAIIQVPDKVILDLDKYDKTHIKLTRISNDKDIYVTEKGALIGELFLKKILTFKNEKIKFKNKKNENPENVNSYLYDIKIKDLGATFRTITQNKIDSHTELIIELPNIRQYLKIEIKGGR